MVLIFQYTLMELLIYKKHHIVPEILVETLLFLVYTKIVNKSTSKGIFESLYATYKRNQ